MICNSVVANGFAERIDTHCCRDNHYLTSAFTRTFHSQAAKLLKGCVFLGTELNGHYKGRVESQISRGQCELGHKHRDVSLRETTAQRNYPSRRLSPKDRKRTSPTLKEEAMII